MKRILIIHVLILVIYAIIEYVFFAYNLNMGGDPKGYYDDAVNIAQPFNASHVPFYPFIIVLLGKLTFGLLEPLVIMRIITGAFWLLSAVSFYKLISLYVKDDNRATLITLVFTHGFFYSLACTYYPITDTIGVSLFITGVYLMHIDKMRRACIFFALAMLTHKIFWIVLFFTFIIWWLYNNKRKLDKNFIINMLIMGGPLMLLYVLGAIYYESATWIIGTNIENEIAAEPGDANLPVFNGLYNELREASTIVDFIKSSFLFFVGGLSVYIIASIKKLHQHNLAYLAGIALTFIGLLVILNQYELNSTLRFSRLLVFPLFIMLEYHGHKVFKSKPLLLILVIGMIGFNVMYGDYIYNYLQH